MPLSSISRIDFDADVGHTRGEVRRPTVIRRKAPAKRPETEDESVAFAIVNEGTASTAGLSILAHALAAYSES